MNVYAGDGKGNSEKVIEIPVVCDQVEISRNQSNHGGYYIHLAEFEIKFYKFHDVETHFLLDQHFRFVGL
jgi:hypothetical protein